MDTIKRHRNKDHDMMMSYLRDTTHNLHAWNYHAGRAADYIDKLEQKLHSLEQDNEVMKETNHASIERIIELEDKLQAYEKATEVGKLRQASARGYCTKRNENKELDADLLEDVVQAITKQIGYSLDVKQYLSDRK